MASVKPIRDYEVPKEVNMIVGSLSEMGRVADNVVRPQVLNDRNVTDRCCPV